MTSESAAGRSGLGGVAALFRSVFFLGWRRYLLLATIAGYLAFLYYLPAAPTIAVVHAKTEQVSFTVVVPEMVRFRLAGYGIRGEVQFSPATAAAPRAAGRAAASTTAKGTGPRKLTCLGGFIQPTAGTKVTIRRFNQEVSRIILDRTDDKPVAEFRAQEQAVAQEIQRASWLLVEESDDCPGTPARRFQISGVVEIGDELRPETSLEEPSSAPLIEGKVEIYGQTIDLGILNNDKRPRLYPVVELSLPPGSRVAEAEDSAKPGARRLWSGMAYVEKDSSAVQVELTTDAQALSLLRPGIGLDPEILKIGMFAQLTNDPNIVALQVVVAIILALVQAFGGWAPTARERGEPESEE